ncbi:MAG: hypothetical protein JNJ43_09890 [Anaerolineales bacterium]|nr:hypothetical protein [Anaerolineales bacterium]
MYQITLLLHSYTRWIVLIISLYTLFIVWRGFLQKSEWTKTETLASRLFVWVFTLQFILGAILFFIPSGLAQTAIDIMSQDFSSAMKTRDIRFFGMEHPLQMTIAMAVVHIGASLARKVTPSTKQFRWAVISFTLGLLLILVGIPWWRPLLRI